LLLPLSGVPDIEVRGAECSSGAEPQAVAITRERGNAPKSMGRGTAGLEQRTCRGVLPSRFGEVRVGLRAVNAGSSCA
jgi:hypothetical protein